jgi:NitT/TauT family transport system substrate-binding protein
MTGWRRRDALAALGAVAALVGAPRAVRAQTQIALRVGTGVADTSSEIWYALKLGMFAKRNLDVQVQQFSSGAAEAVAVAGGSLDIAESNVLSTASAHVRGLSFVYIAPGAQYSSAAPTTVLICAKDAPYRTGKDLNGKTIGIAALRDSSQLGPMAWSERTGGDPNSLRFVELPASEAPAAIIRGSIDAASNNEPFVHMGLQTGKIRILANMFDAIAPQFLQNGWFTTAEWLKGNRGAAAAFADAILEAGRWANRNHKASAEIFKEHSKIAPEAIDAMNRSVFAERFDPALLQPVIDAAAKYKLLDRAFPAAEIMAKLN